MQAKPARGAAPVRAAPPEPERPAAEASDLPVTMSRQERRATVGLAGIFALRMLGMFIILPVFALHAETLPGGSNHTLVGIALGAYGLTQALLQVPFGWASDKWGRKRAIATGLVIFALGSFVAAWAPDIVWTIVGRTLQGAGAISAAVIALTADLTRDQVRTRAMAAIGITIGATFALSLIAAPLLNSAIGVPGIFALTGVLALAAIGVLDRLVPASVSVPAPREPGFAAFRTVLGNGQLARLNYGIFALHAALMALFVIVPLALRDGGLAPSRHWQVYLPVMLASVALMWPALKFADRPSQVKLVLNGAVAVLALAQLMLAFAGSSLSALAVSLMMFFAAFNLLEAVLPSLVSKLAPAALKGTAIGVYSSVQFLGTFVGAALGGVLADYAGPAAVFGFGVTLSVLWLVASATMAQPFGSNYSMGESSWPR